MRLTKTQIYFQVFTSTSLNVLSLITEGVNCLYRLACVAGARKGKEDRAHAMLGEVGGGGTEAPAANPLFISSFLFAGERKIAIGLFLIMCQSLLDMTF